MTCPPGLTPLSNTRPTQPIKKHKPRDVKLNTVLSDYRGKLGEIIDNLDILKLKSVGWEDVRNYPSLKIAVAAITPNQRTLLVSTPVHLAKPTTVPSHISLWVLQGGSFSGAKLTVNGNFEAGLYQVFKGGIEVSFGTGAVKEIYLQWWGAKGDGTTDDTAALQVGFNVAATSGLPLRGKVDDIYFFSTLTIKNGTTKIDLSNCTLLPDGSTDPSNLTTEAAVVLEGVLTGGTKVSNAIISLKIDMQNGDRTAILGDGCDECTFTKCNIFGFTDDATYNHRGIRLQEGASDNLIFDNDITGYDTPTQRGLLIDLHGEVAGMTKYGGFFTGTIVRTEVPAVRNRVISNRLTNGSYGVSLQSAEKSIVASNVLKNQDHRSIYSNIAYNNIIAYNECLDFGSSGVHLSYGTCNCLVIGNQFKNEGDIGLAGMAAINIQCGSSNNLVTSNYIDAPTLYSVYVATDSCFNVIEGNHCKNFYLAGIAAENDWIDTRPTNAIYSRTSYFDPTDLDPEYTSWTFNDLEGTVIKNNTIYHGYPGRNTAAIALAQIENDLAGATLTKMKNTTVKGNTVTSMTNINHCLYIYEHTAGYQEDIYLEGNTWNPATVAADFAAANTSSATEEMKDLGVVLSESNGLLDDVIHGTPISFTDGDATPSITGNWRYFKFENTGATSVTDFDDASEGKEILIRLDVNTTIVHNAALISCKGDVNITGAVNRYVSFKSVSGVWVEVGRNF